jgi:hypothetical protein
MAIRPIRRPAARLAAFAALLWLAACGAVVVSVPAGGPQGGQRIDPGAPVQVALLVPGNSPIQGDDIIARDLENAARLAIADLQGAQIDLRVYPTGASPAQAATIARQAVADGAKIILGPLRADTAAAASAAVAAQNVNVLAFSNNAAIAGGNLFILGPTFENTAIRLTRYAAAQGIGRVFVAHGQDAQGEAGRDAVADAARVAGVTFAGSQGYPVTSQQAVLDAAPSVSAAIDAAGADGVVLTGGINADLPIISSALRESGTTLQQAPFLGLTRWDSLAAAATQTALQGSYFAKPAEGPERTFRARFESAYGNEPHPLAGLAYDGIAAIGALVAQGDPNALTGASLTQAAGFTGTSGIFRLRNDGTNERGLAIAQIRDNQVVIVDPAPSSFGAAGL